MKPLKLGVLGVSGHFFLRCYLPLSQSTMIDIYALASRNEERAREAAEKWDIPVYYDSYEKLLADKNVEAIYIPLPNHVHKEWIKKCADAGKHVICEKPITLNTEETLEASRYAKEKNIKLMEAFMYRFHPKWIRAKEIIRQGEIGKVTSIHTIFTYNNANPSNIRNIKEYGGGALYDIGCYAISTARFLLEKEPTRVIGLAEHDPNFDTDKLTSAIMDFEGTRCLFTVSTQSFPQQEVTVYGTGGKLTVTVPFNDFPDVKGKIVVETGVGRRCVEFDPVDHYQLEFEAFAKAIREDKDVPISSNESINNMKVIDAIFESVEKDKWIEINR